MIAQNSCGACIKQIHDALEKNANNALRHQDLTMAQVGVLLALSGAPDYQLTLKELEHALHVAQSTAAGIVARLEQKGFLEGFWDPSDRRVKMLRLTPAGIECCCEAEDNMKRAERMLLSGLTETEQGILGSLLRKVRDSLI